jgi:hypothetical protein
VYGDEAMARDAADVAILAVVSAVLVALGWGFGNLIIVLITGGHWMAILLPLLPAMGLVLWLGRSTHA